MILAYVRSQTGSPRRGGTVGAEGPVRGRLAQEHALRNQTPLVQRGWLHDPPNARDLVPLGLGLRASGQGWCGDDDAKNVVVWTMGVHLFLLTNKPTYHRVSGSLPGVSWSV